MVVETVQIACDCRDVVLAKSQADVALPPADLPLESRPVDREPLFAPVKLRRVTADAVCRIEHLAAPLICLREFGQRLGR